MPLRRVLLGGGAGGPATPAWMPATRPGIASSAVLDADGTEQDVGVSTQVVIPAYSSDLAVEPAPAITVRAEGTAAKPAANVAGLFMPRNVGSVAAPLVLPALTIAPLPTGTVKPAQNPAISIVTRGEGTPVAPLTLPALSVLPRISQAQSPQTPAGEIVHVEFALTHRRGGVTATATGTWTTAANAQGDPNGTNASAAGEVTGQTKTLKLDFADLANKASLTLTACRLIYYSRLQGAVLNDTSVLFERSLDNGGSWITLETVTANYDELVAGRTFTLSPLPTLAQIQALQARMTVIFPAAGTLKNLAIDAIELEVVGEETWTPA